MAWSEDEVRHAAEDYFDMLQKEMRGERYVKAHHNRQLATKLQGRSRGSIEFKHENISAVLLELECPYIDGYKPRMNYQRLLKEVVLEALERHQAELQKAATLLPPSPQPLPGKVLDSILVAPPPFVPPAKEAVFQPRVTPWKWSFPEQEALNRRLGSLGEEFVLEYEHRRLELEGKKNLAKRIEWVSKRDDSAGFDILSFGVEGKELFIEVKTTNYGRSFPFMISQREVLFSKAMADQYAIYRMFTFRTAPRLFMLPGDISQRCQLEPKTFKASFPKR